MYVNGLLEILNETTGAFLLDERNNFRPAGLAGFGRRRGGHLDDDPHHGRVATVRQVEQFVTEFVTIEQGMMLQNLGLMAQALGLGGFPNFANHEFAWFQALGFRMAQMPASKYLGAGKIVSFGMQALKKNPLVPYAVGLERDGQVLLKPFCPPYYRSMEEAVHAFVDYKYAQGRGTLRDGGTASSWQDGAAVQAGIPRYSDQSIAATVACCTYLYE